MKYRKQSGGYETLLDGVLILISVSKFARIILVENHCFDDCFFECFAPVSIRIDVSEQDGFNLNNSANSVKS